METKNPEPRPQYRTINKNGSLNIEHTKHIGLKDLYHDMLKATWLEFTCMFTAVFICLNSLFGVIYFLMPPGELDGYQNSIGFRRFLENFFFSVQTFGTIGYGRISPMGVGANLVVTLECYTSLFVVAVLTGLIFARFARPNAKVMFSHHAVVRSFDGLPSLMFRMANARQNYVTDARVKVSLALDDPTTGFRNFAI